MKVWVLTNHYQEVSVYSEDTDVLEIPYVKAELSYLETGYEGEREEFMEEVAYISTVGHGSALIEERFSLELQKVK